MRIRKVSTAPIPSVDGAVVDSLSGSSTTNAPSVRAVNEGLSGIIKVVQTTHSVNFSSTGWKHGSFTYSSINGYELVAVAPRYIPYSDVNFISYNINESNNTVRWTSYVSYAGSQNIANINLIYVKTDFISQ